MTINIQGLTHDHIDGSIAMADIILDLYRLAGRTFPFPSIDDWLKWFRENVYRDLVGCFSTITGVLQTEEALGLAGYAYGRRRIVEGYRYVEGKFAPQYHVFGGLTMRQAVAAMIGGLKRAERGSGVRIRPVICIGREVPPETGVEIAKIALDYGGEAILDLACDEANHPPEKHLPAYQLTRGLIRRDCHAGEWVSPEPRATYRERLLANVRTAVRVLEVDGLGHAIPLADDPDLVREVVARNVRVSGSPASYVQSGLIKDVRELRLDELLNRGVTYALNADDDLFLPSVAEEVALCEAGYDLTAYQRTALSESTLRWSTD